MRILFTICFLLSALQQSHAQNDNNVPKEVFSYVEQMPEFPGGESALNKYLEQNIQYPSSAKEQGLEGKVYIKFIISETGEIMNPVSMKQSPKILEDEAIRVIKAMPKWRPGKQNGRAVNVFFQLPINFRLGGNDYIKKDDVIFTRVEQMPEFPGGPEKMKLYFEKKKLFVDKNFTTMPSDISFTIDQTGKAVDLKIITAMRKKLEKKIRKAFAEMPLWSPGKINGKAVPWGLKLHLLSKKPNQ
jgi:TonB family protein